MNGLQFDMKNDKFVVINGLLGLVAAVSVLFIMILLGFHGSYLLWLILSAGAAAMAYLVSIKTMTKFVAGIAFLLIPVCGAIVNWLLTPMGFVLLMNIFLWITIIGLFGYFYIERDSLIDQITMIAAGLFTLCHLLPFTPGGYLPLQLIFKESFIFALIDLLMLFAAAVVFLIFILSKLQAQLPVEPVIAFKISFFVLLGGVILKFLLGLFDSESVKIFILMLFQSLFYWSLGIMAGLSMYIIKEGQENRVLEVKFKM